MSKSKKAKIKKANKPAKDDQKNINAIPHTNAIATWFNDLRYGQSLSVEFFTQHAWLLIIFIVTMLALIGLRYKTKSKMAEIKTLTIELDRAESTKLQEKSRYMSLIRETEMKRLVDKRHLSLDFQERPPYELVVDRE
ncbi:MAG: hypothetical protein K2J29_05860 [Muribaculaceae bacterium]|nr:hypothetical protein [Bacteroides sp.]MDE6804137.1 hypothetical protein [Muribaculaceae bacterium]MDE6841918.1 hypothetical protein [Muribaculaceae bacterium]MDE7189972.1 hypothetical protein [Muribaculaceae bacterium]